MMLPVGLLVCSALLHAGEGARGVPDLKSLYDAHQWFELRDALADGSGPALYRGAVAAAFNRVPEAEALLKPVIENGSDSEMDQASEWLSYMYMRAGRYREAAAQMGDDSSMKSMIASLPDQSIGKFEPSTMSCRMSQRHLYIPVSIKGARGEFFVDSDANFSFMSDSEARNLGLVVRDSDVPIHGGTGKQAKFRIAVVPVLAIGKAELENVAFLVLSDSEEVFRGLAVAQQGSLGLPVMLALRTIRADRVQGTFEIGLASQDSKNGRTTICFDGLDPVALVDFEQQRLAVVIDTGAAASEIWPPFAKRFREIVESGKPDAQVENGIGGKTEVPARVLPELKLCVGGFDARMRPAHVLLNPTTANSEWYYARLGLDVLSLARSLTIDFESLQLHLQ